MSKPDDAIGLDYLYKSGKLQRGGTAESQESAVSAPSRFEASLRAYVPRRFLQAVDELQSAGPEEGARLQAVAERLDLDASVAVPLAKRLEDVGFIRVVEARWADDLVAITPEGRNALSSSDESAFAQMI